jgi:hypothetical protein
LTIEHKGGMLGVHCVNEIMTLSIICIKYGIPCDN